MDPFLDPLCRCAGESIAGSDDSGTANHFRALGFDGSVENEPEFDCNSVPNSSDSAAVNQYHAENFDPDENPFVEVKVMQKTPMNLDTRDSTAQASDTGGAQLPLVPMPPHYQHWFWIGLTNCMIVSAVRDFTEGTMGLSTGQNGRFQLAVTAFEVNLQNLAMRSWIFTVDIFLRSIRPCRFVSFLIDKFETSRVFDFYVSQARSCEQKLDSVSSCASLSSVR